LSKTSIDKKRTLFSLEELSVGFAAIFEKLDKNGLIGENAEVHFSGGEITINPSRQYLYDICSKYPAYRYIIFSNCFIYDEQIAKILAQNENVCLMCDLDAGTPETYIAVKGFNKFDIAAENLQKYARCGKVQVKYVVMPGINDFETDFNGTIRILKHIGLDALLLAADYGSVSQNDDILLRKIAFSVAKFMILMDEQGIKHDFIGGVFNSKQVSLVLRLYNELKALKKT
jgi:hypothetical protein